MSNTHIQLRGICPVCFNQQALKSGRMVDHGFTVPQQWSGRQGSCAGTGESHFGTTKGRDFTIDTITALGKFITKLINQQHCTGRGETLQRTIRARNEAGRIVDKVVDVTRDDPMYQRVAERKREVIESNIREAKNHKDMMVKGVRNWNPAEPIEVKAVDNAPKLHLKHPRPHGNRIAWCDSTFAKGYKMTTDDPSKVTCSRCQKELIRREEKAAKSK